MMKAGRLLFAIFILLMSTPMRSEETAEKDAEAHDYSRPTLLYIFSQSDEEETSNEPDMTFQYSTRNWTFRWLPFLTSILPNEDMGSATLMPIPNPFTLLGMDYPQTAETYPDRGPQTRYRRKMVAVVTAANRADKLHRLGRN